MKKKITLTVVLIIIILSVITHFAFFGRPNSTVFDEVHFGKFVSGYLNHKYFFDIHPPLGKLAIAGVAKLTGFKTGFDFKVIGEKYPDRSYLWLRLLPVLAGTLLPIVIFFLARELRLSLLASFSASLLIIFENALLGQSLFILLDSMLLLFGFLGLLLYLIYKRQKSIYIFILAVVSLSFALSIKWTGAALLGLVFIFEIFDLVKNKVQKRTVPKLIILVFLPLIIYFSVFALHFSILKNPGEGDAFMSKDFKTENVLQKFIELNREMYRANGRIADNHPYSSKWYTWPMMARPIYYWNEGTAPSEAKIYLFGNPIIFWASLLGVIILILNTIFYLRFLRKIKTSLFIILGFIINYLPFALITRPMFLYHYLSALIFGILALCFSIDAIKNKRLKVIIFILIVTLAIASFFFFAPLTYGLKMSASAFNLRLWTKNWQ